MRGYLLLMIALVVQAAGCTGATPKVSISDPQVYTMRQVLEAQRSVDAAVSLRAALHRNFLRSQDARHDPRLVADLRLDNTQRSSEQMNQLTALLRADLTLATANLASASPQTRPAFESVKKFVATTRPALTADSPFDQLDRVTDFYTALLLKSLQNQRPDGRTRASMLPLMNPPGGRHRVLLLCMQTHLDPGTRRSHYAGVRVNVVSVLDEHGEPIPPKHLKETLKAEEKLEASKSSVQILRVHPTRFYDLDDTNYQSGIDEATEFGAHVPGGTVAADVERRERSVSDQHRKFLSRIPKQASFVSANDKLFGWNFYPSNLQLQRRGMLSMITEALLGRPGNFDVYPTLEGGARDAAVFVLVPSEARYLNLRIGYLYASWSGAETLHPRFFQDMVEGRIPAEPTSVKGRDVIVPLPPDDDPDGSIEAKLADASNSKSPQLPSEAKLISFGVPSSLMMPASETGAVFLVDQNGTVVWVAPASTVNAGRPVMSAFPSVDEQLDHSLAYTLYHVPAAGAPRGAERAENVTKTIPGQ
jgi:hypothetical protein